ncbi:MAG: hypothetical protein ACOCW3_00435 [Spirochaetota bacterium]
MITTRRCFVALFLLIMATAGAGAAESRVTLSLGHAGAVRAIAGRNGLDLAVSAGEDGKLLAWDLLHDGLWTSWQVAHVPLTRLAVHPDRPEVVVFAQDGLSSGRLIGMDWETGKRLFETEVDGTPNFLEYSPQGSFVVYSLDSFDSLFMVDAETGRRRSYIDDEFGVVSFVQIARSERNIMTYVPSRGEFIYWQLSDGSELQTVDTLKRLAHLTLIDHDTQRFLAAASGDELVVVDNLTGATMATYPVSPIHGISYDPQTERLVVLTEQAGRRTSLAFTYRSGRLRRNFYTLQNPSPDTATIAAVGSGATRGFLTGDTNGEISWFDDTNGRRTALGPAPDTRVVDLAFTPGRLNLALAKESRADELLSVVSDLFDDDRRDVSASFVRDTRTRLDDMERLRFTADGERLLVWGGEEAGSIWELLTPSAEPQRIYDDETGVPVRTVRATEAGPLVVHRDGRIVLLSREAEGERFRHKAVGAQDALWDPQLGLVTAKTRTSSFDSSLMIVDPLTEETVAARTDAFLTTELELDPRSRTLYAIGLHGRQSDPTTRLLELTGSGFSQRTVVDESSRELSGGDLLWDSREGVLLSSMTYDEVRRYRSGRDDGSLEPVERLHGTLALGGSLIAAANLDGSVSFWRRESGEHVADLVVVGSEWIAITRRGEYLTSSRAAERYLTFLPASRTRLELGDFRLSLPFAE